MKHALEEGHPPCCKRARRHSSSSSSDSDCTVRTLAPPPRCDLSAEACRQRLQTKDSAEEALDALLQYPELLYAYAHLGGGALFYLTYALAHAKESLTVTTKCLHVLVRLVPLVSCTTALRATGVTTYITQAMHLYPSLTSLGQALVQAISMGQSHVALAATATAAASTAPSSSVVAWDDSSSAPRCCMETSW